MSSATSESVIVKSVGVMMKDAEAYSMEDARVKILKILH